MKSACLKSRVIVAGLIAAALSVAQITSLKQKSYVAGRFAFVLDGSKNAGFLHSVEGGGVRSEEIKVEMGMSMGQPMKDWIDASLRAASRRNGSIAYAKTDAKVEKYLDFRDAIITEVRIPPADRSSNAAGFLNLKIKPTSSQFRPGNNLPAPSTLPAARQKPWHSSNFKFEMAGLDCRSITQIRFPNLVTKTPAPGGPVPIPYPNVTAQAASWEFKNGWPVKWVGPEFDAWQRNFRPRPGRLVLLDEKGAQLLQINFRMNKLIKGIPNQNGRSMSFELMFDTFEMR